MKDVEFPAGVLDDLRAFEAEDRRQIGRARHLFAATGAGDIRTLKGYKDQLRLRVGEWRIRFVEDPPGTIFVIRVARRDKAYKT